MPEIVSRLGGTEQGRVMSAVAELADNGLVERMRLDAAVRVLVTAKRLLAIAPRDAASGAAAATVLRVVRGWDATATTAGEHVETLAPSELDAFLAAAPRWAASVRDAAGGEARRAA